MIRTLAVALPLVAAGISLAPAADTTRPAKKLIEWGWDEPDQVFMRANVAAMEEMPFDGLVFHVKGAKPGRLEWEAWGGRAFAEDEFRAAVDDLRATPFRRLTERFLRMNATPGTADWFDDKAWGVVVHNFGVAARVAKAAGCRGFMFDVEQYEGQPFDYGKQKHRSEKSFAEYRVKVRQRGREWVTEVNSQYPDITVLLTFGYSLAQPRRGQERSAAHYGLLADFLDGVLDGCSERTAIVDAFEQAYPFKDPRQFEQGYATIRESGPKWTAAPEKYRRHVRAGFGLWMDYDWRKKGWETTEVSKNHFTPESFGAAVRAALRVSDGYVWVYTEQPRWWTREKLPQAYIDALKKAREG